MNIGKSGRAVAESLPAPYPGPPAEVEMMMRPLVGDAVWFEYLQFVSEQQRQGDGLARVLAAVSKRVGGAM